MTMDEPLNADQVSRQRKQAVKTAWVLGIVALVIFATFIASAVIGR